MERSELISNNKLSNVKRCEPQTVVHADKKDKKAVLRFYKEHLFTARFKGFDNTYFIKDGAQIIACVIVSQITLSNPQSLLHALFVDFNHQKQGLAKLLLNTCKTHHHSIVLFASKQLANFYQKHGFSLVPQEKIKGILSDELGTRFTVYKNKQPDLVAFIWQMKNH
ncbi:N-acetyltransferase [Colwellia sp. RSH04]|nr:N-acetyltransferase [Colwellia sp. RSH04]